MKLDVLSEKHQQNILLFKGFNRTVIVYFQKFLLCNSDIQFYIHRQV
jgi:hypothetical protein